MVPLPKKLHPQTQDFLHSSLLLTESYSLFVVASASAWSLHESLSGCCLLFRCDGFVSLRSVCRGLRVICLVRPLSRGTNCKMSLFCAGRLEILCFCWTTIRPPDLKTRWSTASAVGRIRTAGGLQNYL